ncbi:RNA-directed DNA polymerase, eukaryota [Tanacetum coccineum]
MIPYDGFLRTFLFFLALVLNGVHGSVVVLTSSMASILVNGSPTFEFQFHRGLKQGDPLAPYLFILVMESLHLSFSRVIEQAYFTGEWSQENLNGIMQMLRCFSLLSGLSINIKKSHILGVGIPSSLVNEAASRLGCSVMKVPFKYLGITVGGKHFLVKSWDDTIYKHKSRLSKWKLKTLSIGGRFTLLKSVLGSTPIYNMSLYKVPKAVLNTMESIRRKFFNGIQENEKKIAWIKWTKGLAAAHPSNWSTIIKEVDVLKAQECSVTSKMSDSFTSSFRRVIRGGIESTQLSDIMSILGSVILSSNEDRYFWDLNGDGDFRVKDVRNLIDETFLPKDVSPTRWVKSIPIKVNIFAWKVSLDRLPTRFNLVSRGVPVPSLSCLSCNIVQEDLGHTLFSCDLAIGVSRLVCRWWNLTWTPLDSYASWLNWFKLLRMSSSSKGVLEGVFLHCLVEYLEF